MATLNFLTRGIGLNTPEVGVGSDAFLQLLFGGDCSSFAGETVTEDTALGVTAVWQAVQMISNTMAVLPLKVFRETAKGRKEANGDPLAAKLSGVVNSATFLTSHKWRKMMQTRLLVHGRAFSYIEEDNAGRVANIFYLNPDRVQVVAAPDGLNVEYHYTQPNHKVIVYRPDQIIDLVWNPCANGIDHVNPINALRHAIGLSIASTRYASRVFETGGAPQLVATGPLGSPEATSRASKMMKAALEASQRDGKAMMVAPDGWDIKAVGFDPTKSQLLELRKFQVEEIARIFNVSPSLLMDMSTGTFSNVEQQDLAFAKHTVHHWTELWEAELNAKLNSPRTKGRVIEFSLDGLQRGDYASRGQGLALRVQNGLLTPNEGRALDNLEPLDGGDQLLVQGAMEPLTEAGQKPAQPVPLKPLAKPAAEDQPQDQDQADNQSDTANAATS
jgi:HK97 family phage portal protein